MLSEGLNTISDEKQFSPQSSWRFSDLGKCNRYQILKRLGFRGGEFSPKTKFIFEMGHMIEDMALNWLSRVKRVDILARQVKIEASQFDARGSADALARFGNQLTIIEVKSTRDKALSYRIPYETHKRQAGAYAMFLGLPRAVLAYIGRDGTIAHAWVEVTEELKNTIRHQWEVLEKYWSLDLPDRNGNDKEYFTVLEPYLPLKLPHEEKIYKRAGPWGPAGTVKMELNNECGYCAFKNLCWGGNNEYGPSGKDSSEADGLVGGVAGKEAGQAPDPQATEDAGPLG